MLEEGLFAVHGGTTINIFLKDLPKYSVDIDLTYIPLADRKQSLEDINLQNLHLASICELAKQNPDKPSEKAAKLRSLFKLG